MRAVSRTAEWRRVDAIPRRLLVEALDLTDRFRKPDGLERLRPIQSWALNEIAEHGGCLGPIGVGWGKTLITLLAQRAAGAARALLLLPKKLIAKTKAEAERYAHHWAFELPRIESYQKLGNVKAATLLDDYAPDIIIADECQKLKNRSAAVTRRVLRYIREARKAGRRVVCVFLSGTLTKQSLHDFWHLAALCLPELPMPRGWPELSEWADAIDAKVEPWQRVAPGALLQWGPADETDPMRRARLGFQQRLKESAGVVATDEAALGCSLQIGFEVAPPPDAIEEALAAVQDTWTRPDGYPFSDILSLSRYLRQLALGFYYRWTEQPPEQWLAARKAWASFVRDTITRSRRYDSEQQVALACGRGELDTTTYSVWRAVRPIFSPVTECVWLSHFAIDACAKWLAHNSPALMWTEHVEFAKELAQNVGCDYYGEQGVGLTSGKLIESATGNAVLSVSANGEGRNLQAWCHNLITSCPSSGDIFEQLLGRTHRPGQEADTVTADVLVTNEVHVRAFSAALAGARYLQDSLGQPQKLLYGDIVIDK